MSDTPEEVRLSPDLEFAVAVNELRAETLDLWCVAGLPAELFDGFWRGALPALFLYRASLSRWLNAGGSRADYEAIVWPALRATLKASPDDPRSQATDCH